MSFIHYQQMRHYWSSTFGTFEIFHIMLFISSRRRLRLRLALASCQGVVSLILFSSSRSRCSLRLRIFFCSPRSHDALRLSFLCAFLQRLGRCLGSFVLAGPDVDMITVNLLSGYLIIMGPFLSVHLLYPSISWANDSCSRQSLQHCHSWISPSSMATVSIPSDGLLEQIVHQ